MHTVSDLASEPSDFPGLHQHKLVRKTAERIVVYPWHVKFKPIQEV